MLSLSKTFSSSDNTECSYDQITEQRRQYYRNWNKNNAESKKKSNQKYYEKRKQLYQEKQKRVEELRRYLDHLMIVKLVE